MSVVEKLSKLFSKKSEDEPQIENSGELSLAMPDASVDPMATGSMETRQPEAAVLTAPDPDSVTDDSIATPEDAEQADLISIPVVGRHSAACHQRFLGGMPMVSLFIRAPVAVFAVRQPDDTAQHVAGTGT